MACSSCSIPVKYSEHIFKVPSLITSSLILIYFPQLYTSSCLGFFQCLCFFNSIQEDNRKITHHAGRRNVNDIGFRMLVETEMINQKERKDEDHYQTVSYWKRPLPICRARPALIAQSREKALGEAFGSWVSLRCWFLWSSLELPHTVWTLNLQFHTSLWRGENSTGSWRRHRKWASVFDLLRPITQHYSDRAVTVGAFLFPILIS